MTENRGRLAEIGSSRCRPFGSRTVRPTLAPPTDRISAHTFVTPDVRPVARPCDAWELGW